MATEQKKWMLALKIKGKIEIKEFQTREEMIDYAKKAVEQGAIIEAIWEKR